MEEATPGRRYITIINRMTKIRPITPAIKLVLRASLPRVAPTTLSWILVSSSGRAPIRRVDASSSASENFSKPPEIVHLPSVIALLIVGADTSLLSYTIAIWLPTFASVISPNFLEPLELNVTSTTFSVAPVL